MSSLARGLTDGERTLLAGIADPEPRCFTCGDEPGDCPDCRPYCPPAPFELETGPPTLGLTLVELAAAQASWFRSWGTDAGDLFAEALDDLAGSLRLTAARTPDQHRERIEALGRMT